MLCGGCGAAIAPGMKFCTQCGRAVDAAPDQTAATVAQPAPGPAAIPAPKPKLFSAAWFGEPIKYGTFSLPRFIVLAASLVIIVFGLMTMMKGIGELSGGGQQDYYQDGYGKP